jgi:hypothetical protein
VLREHHAFALLPGHAGAVEGQPLPAAVLLVAALVLLLAAVDHGDGAAALTRGVHVLDTVVVEVRSRLGTRRAGERCGPGLRLPVRRPVERPPGGRSGAHRGDDHDRRRHHAESAAALHRSPAVRDRLRGRTLCGAGGFRSRRLRPVAVGLLAGYVTGVRHAYSFKRSRVQGRWERRTRLRVPFPSAVGVSRRLRTPFTTPARAAPSSAP